MILNIQAVGKTYDQTSENLHAKHYGEDGQERYISNYMFKWRKPWCHETLDINDMGH